MQPIKQWYSELKKVVFESRKFFTQMKTRGGFNEPLQFSLTTVGILAAIVGLATLSVVGFVLTLVIAFLLWTVVLFAQSFVYHIYLKIVGGHAPYEATFRIFAYLTPLTLMSAWIGATVGKNIILIIAFVALWCYVKYVEVNATSYHHKIPVWKGAIAILVFPLIVGLLFLLTISVLGGVPIEELLVLYYNYSI